MWLAYIKRINFHGLLASIIIESGIKYIMKNLATYTSILFTLATLIGMLADILPMKYGAFMSTISVCVLTIARASLAISKELSTNNIEG